MHKETPKKRRNHTDLAESQASGQVQEVWGEKRQRRRNREGIAETRASGQRHPERGRRTTRRHSSPAKSKANGQRRAVSKRVCRKGAETRA